MNFLRFPVRLARAAFVVVPALTLGPSLAAQETIVLTLGGAARLAAEKSAPSEVGRLRADQARGRVRQRRAELLPSLSAALGENERTFNSASFGISFRDAATGRFLFNPDGEVLGPVRGYDLRGTLRQPLLDLSALARLRASRASAGAASADADAAAQQAAAGAAVTYVRVLRADAQLAARVADSSLSEELLGIARDQLAAGVGIALDVTRARSQRAATRAQLIAARNERDRSHLELYRALGLPLGVPLKLADSLLALPTTDLAPSEQDATARAMRGRADLRAADEQLHAGERQLAALRAERLPSLGLYADQGATGRISARLLSTYTWGLQVSVPIFDGFRREGREDEQRSSIKEIDVRRRDLAQQATIEVRGALLDLAAAREALGAAEERLNLAEQELTQSRDRFKAGVAGNADVITASLGLNAARTLMVDARAAFHSARVALARAQGATTELP
jgi:outer membrane protein TolC